MIDRRIMVVLPDRSFIHYCPTHEPVRRQAGEILNLVWEQQDGSLLAVAINTEQVAIIEETVPPQDLDEDTLRLIEEAKAKDAEQRRHKARSTGATKRDLDRRCEPCTCVRHDHRCCVHHLCFGVLS